MELYKLVCLIVASAVVLFIVLFIIRDLFIDMRKRNISQRSKMQEKANRVTRNRESNKSSKKSKFKVYKGSNRKKGSGDSQKPRLIKIK